MARRQFKVSPKAVTASTRVNSEVEAALDEVMYQVWENYDNTDDVSSECIVQVWLDHIYMDDELAESVADISDSKLVSIGKRLYNNYSWEEA